ncbi:MAG TPA: SDR family NAD(P)-dependent oxidoreductase [Geminicoccaceae bacterium]|nr:SDR family NAD(P)-dependent oxidoreductase [Geminicoccaceae bacterium]
MIRLDEQVAIVTGGGRGLGLAYALLLAERGARVVLHDIGADREGLGSDPGVATAAVMAIEGAGGTAIASAVGLDARGGCRELVEAAMSRFGRLDILVHNAGWVGYQRVEEITPEFLKRAMDIHVQAPTWLAQSVFPIMARVGYGRIVLTTSDRAIYKQYAQRGLAAYAMGKMAQIGFMNILAAEGEEHGILVNAVSPVAKTRMWGVEDEPDELRPDQVAPGVLYLASPECRETGYILRASNGQFIAAR